MYFAKMFVVKEGKIGAVRKWLDQLANERKAEALATLVTEDVTREVYILFRAASGADYIVGISEAPRNPAPGDPSISINEEHNAVKKECLEPIASGEILLDLAP